MKAVLLYHTLFTDGQNRILGSIVIVFIYISIYTCGRSEIPLSSDRRAE